MTTGIQPPTAPKRSRARTFVPLGIAVWVVLEIWLLLLVADAVGGLTVLFLLVGALVFGAAVVKRAGRRAFRNLTETVQRQQSGELPAQERESGGNGFLMLSGLLIMLPGLITDVIGLLLLVPPLRSALSRYTERTVERRMGRAAPGTVGDAFQQARMHRPDGKVVQGEVIKNDDRPGPGGDDEGPRPPLTP
ncbi:FxsA family membrane protein [Streptomyces sp. NBC_01197]|uniref:FxsA family membrane protein n=1 Tax=Streptomyces sp. NBC_01197 TaxID=2903768 RepID=UPI002E127797|nr:FxsA family protein [Streptomyces sp. NBC_01197]